MWMKVKKLHDNATIPHRAHDTDAGLDVCAIENGCVHGGKDGIIKTGIAISLPDGWVAIVKEKSGRATKDKITIGACVIDSGYRGEILLHVFNNEPDIPFTYRIGDKIAQLVVVPCWCGQPEEVDELDETERGEGRMGSTGDRVVTKNLSTEEGKKIWEGVDKVANEVPPWWRERMAKRDYPCSMCGGKGDIGGCVCKRCNGCGKHIDIKLDDEKVNIEEAATASQIRETLGIKPEFPVGMVVTKNLSTEEGRKIWAGVDKVAEGVPPWWRERMKAKFEEQSSNDVEPQCKYTHKDIKDCDCGDC